MEKAFGAALRAEATALSDLEGVNALVFNPVAPHPLMRTWHKERASLHRASGAYYIPAPINYVAWTRAEWPSRLDAFAAALIDALASLPKSKFKPASREALSAAIRAAKEALSRSPPQRVEPMGPVYLSLDDTDKPVSVSFRQPPAVVGGRVLTIEPEEAARYEGVDLWPAPGGPQAFKFYRRDQDGRLHYREAWFAETKVIEHWGVCGERGENRAHETPSSSDASRVLSNLSRSARADGYRPVQERKMRTLILEFSVDGSGSPKDLERRHALEAHFDQLVGWLGLGHVDGGAIGSNVMEIAIRVVDFEIARVALEAATRGTKGGGFTRIYEMR